MDTVIEPGHVVDERKVVRMLYIEDDTIGARLVKRSLERQEGFRVDLAENGQRGIELATANRYDILLVDHDMPKIGGLEFLRWLREKGDRTPAIMITGAGNEETATSALKSGYRDYVVKDVDGAFLRLLPGVVEQTLKQERADRILEERHRENQRLLAELLESNRQLENLNELKNEALGIAAHDLRSPLSAIVTAVNVLLSEETSETSRRYELLKICQRSSAQLLNIVEELLNPKRLEAGDLALSLERRPLAEIVREMADLNRGAADRKRIAIDCSGVDPAAAAPVDPFRCRELVDNLLNNAIKYAPPGSQVTLQVFPSDGRIWLSVRDEGPGFTEEDQRHLYKRFCRLSARPTANETSTGLGLSIVKRIADLHRAEIRLMTRPGSGSEFLVGFLAD